jgi:MFS family permease
MVALNPDLRPLKATYREWIGLAVLALPCIVYAMDLTVLNLAVPSLSAELKPSAAELLWIVDIYGFLAAGSGGAMGPAVGGLILERFWWGAVFLAPVPVMLLLLVAGPRLLPEHRNARAGRLDLLSAVLSVVAVLPVIYGIKLAAEGGSLVTASFAAVIGLAFGAWFLLRQATLSDPLLDLTLFRRPAVTTALAVYTLESLWVSAFSSSSRSIFSWYWG